MSQEMITFINQNYTLLFNKYCKYYKYNIKNSCTVEDKFQDKILDFIQLDIKNPNIELLLLFFKNNKRKAKGVKYILTNNTQFIEYYEDPEEIEINEKLKLLFINYRKEK
jgi:hypothetical protein